MNDDLLRVFETESDYDSAKDSFIYPTVSYVRDVDEVKYMDAPQPLLPRDIDTNGYTTDFVAGQYYPQEALVFKAIFDMYSSYLNNPRYDSICIKSGELYGRILDVNEDTYNRLDIAYVGNEPLYKNYLINFENDGDDERGDICMFRDDVSFAQKSYYILLRYEDGLFVSNSPV